MPKNLLEDMVKAKAIKKGTAIEKELKSEVEDKFNSYYKTLSKKDKKRGDRGGKQKNSLWFLALISALCLFFALSFLMSKAIITIYPKQKDVTLNQSVLAIRDSTNEKDLPFDLTVISGEETTSLEAGAEVDVSERAKGTVVIYNTYSSASQGLKIDTRLEGSNGKIYKISSAVTIPGMKGRVPGSVEVGIYATDPGESYNSAPLDFKIFGFKGTAKYTKFYARSKGDITGGFVGKKSTISEEQKTEAVDILKATLEEKLYKKISDQIPDGFVLFKDAVVLATDSESFDSSSSPGKINVTVKGTLYGFLFNETKLTKKIVDTSLAGHDGSPVDISNIKDLKFVMANKESISFKDTKSISFSLSGNPMFVWGVDTEKIAKELMGKSKKDFNEILSQYPNIDSANLVIKPVWKFSLPKEKKNIKITVTPKQ